MTPYLSYLLCFVLVALTVSAKSEKNFDDDYVYVEKYKASYKAHLTQATWDIAAKGCSNEEALLMVPRSLDEARSIMRMLVPGKNEIWTGVKEIYYGFWAAQNGEFLINVYNHWFPSQPQYQSNQLCTTIKRDGRLWDRFCTQKHYYICKREFRKFEETSIVPTRSDEYVYVEEFKAHYRMYYNSSTWKSAAETCASSGASLMVPKTLKEAQTIIKMMNIDQKYIWVGFNDIDYEGVWITQSGDLMMNIYEFWNWVQPNTGDIGEAQDCGMIQVDGLIWDDDCAKKFNFICKKK